MLVCKHVSPPTNVSKDLPKNNFCKVTSPKVKNMCESIARISGKFVKNLSLGKIRFIATCSAYHVQNTAPYIGSKAILSELKL